MDRNQLLDNIRADFFHEFLPLTQIHVTGDDVVDEIPKLKKNWESIRDILQKNIVKTTSLIVARNCIEFGIVNCLPGDLDDFEKRVFVTFLSATGASTTISLIFDHKRNSWNLVSKPLIYGSVKTLVILFEDIDRTTRYLQKRCPSVLEFLRKYLFYNEITEFYKDVVHFLNDPRDYNNQTKFQQSMNKMEAKVNHVLGQAPQMPFLNKK